MKAISSIALLLVFLTPSAFAQWQLQGNDSSVNFVSVKSSTTAEVHHFKKLTGAISDTGAVALNIDLASVETNIGIRNDRVKSMLFETSTFLQANVTGAIDIEKVASLNVGDSYVETVKLDLDLHGASQEVSNEVQVVKLNDGKLLVSSIRPVVINASSFGLEPGIEQLRTVAKLPSISTAVPVTFNLIFVQ